MFRYRRLPWGNNLSNLVAEWDSNPHVRLPNSWFSGLNRGANLCSPTSVVRPEARLYLLNSVGLETLSFGKLPNRRPKTFILPRY